MTVTGPLDLSHEKLLGMAHASLVCRLTPGAMHEVKNPLAVVLGFAQTVLAEVSGKSTILAEDVRQDLDMIEEGASRCRQVVELLHEFARPIKPVGSEPTLVPLRQVIDHAASLIAFLARERHVTIRTDWVFGKDIEVWIPGIPAHLLYLLVELLHNAVHASEVRSVAITLRSEDNVIAIAIENDGAVIPPAVLGQAFEPFYSTHPRGVGLGLPVARWICLRHGGSLDLEPLDGLGAVATIRLPRDQ